MFDWNDLRFFLAVVRTGNSIAAAAEMRASQSTVTRRIDAIETALRLRLFERTARGYRMTDQARSLLPLAEAAEAAMVQLFEAAGTAKTQLSGKIRFAVPPTTLVLSPVVDFMRRHPGVVVEVIPAGAFHNVAGGDVDVAFRAGPQPREPDLIVRKIGNIIWQGCCSREYLTKFGKPAGYDDLQNCDVIGVDRALADSPPFRRWAELVGRRDKCAATIDDLIASIRAGEGIGLLPEATIAELDDVTACLPPLEDAPSETWLITRDDLRQTPHVRAFIDFMVNHLSTLLKHRPWYEANQID